jgi:hypothetical protein
LGNIEADLKEILHEPVDRSHLTQHSYSIQSRFWCVWQRIFGFQERPEIIFSLTKFCLSKLPLSYEVNIISYLLGKAR